MDNQQERHVYISYNLDQTKFYVGSRKGKIEDSPSYFGSYSDSNFDPREKILYSHHRTPLVASFVENNLIRTWGITKNFVNKQRFCPIQDPRSNALSQHLKDPEYSKKFQKAGTKASKEKFMSLTPEEREEWNCKKGRTFDKERKDKVSRVMKEWYKNPDNAHAIEMKRLKNKRASSGSRNPSAKAIRTPYGIFGCKKDAYTFMGISKSKFETIIKNNPEDYVILNGYPEKEYESSDLET